MKKIIYLIIGFLGLWITAGYCDDRSAGFTVSATVQGSCEVPIILGDIDFGVYSGGQTDASTEFAVSCSSGTEYRPYITPSSRVMTYGLNSLPYQLYEPDPPFPGSVCNYGIPFPASVGDDPSFSALGTGADQHWAICGRIEPAIVVPPGAYTQSVILHIDFIP